MSPEQATFEHHYRIGELAEMWRLGRETVSNAGPYEEAWNCPRTRNPQRRPRRWAA